MLIQACQLQHANNGVIREVSVRLCACVHNMQDEKCLKSINDRRSAV